MIRNFGAGISRRSAVPDDGRQRLSRLYRHLSRVASGMDVPPPRVAQPISPLRIDEQFVQPFRQMLRIFRPVQQSAFG
jgi:hypothetical protein